MVKQDVPDGKKIDGIVGKIGIVSADVSSLKPVDRMLSLIGLQADCKMNIYAEKRTIWRCNESLMRAII